MIPKFPRSALAVLLCLGCNPATLIAAQKCFKTRDELKYAVDSCWEGGKGHESNYGTELENDANEEDCEIAKYEMHEAYNSKPTEYKLATNMNAYCVEFESFPIQGLMNKIDLGV